MWLAFLFFEEFLPVLFLPQSPVLTFQELLNRGKPIDFLLAGQEGGVPHTHTGCPPPRAVLKIN